MLAPIPTAATPLDSIGTHHPPPTTNYLPSKIASQEVLFNHLLPLLNERCKVFGSTCLPGWVQRIWLARKLMSADTRNGILGNSQDDLDGLRRELERRFIPVSIEVVGAVALFMAQR